MVNIELGLKPLLSGFAAIVLMPTFITCIALVLYKKAPYQQPMILIFTVCALMFGLGVLLSFRNYLKIDDHNLVVKAGPHSVKIPFGSSFPEFRKVLGDEMTQYKPKFKTAGTAFPYFHTGRFMLRNGRAAFVAIIGDYETLTIIETDDQLVVTNANYDLIRDLASTVNQQG